MLLLPAIDLMSGQVVRLRQGRAQEKTVYPGSPAEWAQRWQRAGGDWLHVVDLDAAFHGTARNLDAVRDIVGAVTIPVELGGGLREESDLRRAFDLGVSRVVIGTRAIESADFVRDMVQRFGPERIAVGLDAKDGFAALKGWTEQASINVIDAAKQMAALGVGTIVYTDIATDGMMQGPNFAGLDALLAAVSCPVIASGGVSRNDDLYELARRERLHGVIIGRALYDETVNLNEFRQAGG